MATNFLPAFDKIAREPLKSENEGKNGSAKN
jgi:hypothetical protein